MKAIYLLGVACLLIIGVSVGAWAGTSVYTEECLGGPGDGACTAGCIAQTACKLGNTQRGCSGTHKGKVCQPSGFSFCYHIDCPGKCVFDQLTPCQCQNTNLCT